MEVLKVISIVGGLLITGIVAFMNLKARTDRANDLVEKVETKVMGQDKDIRELGSKIDLVLEKLKPLDRLEDIITKQVKSEMDSRELENLKG